MKEQCLFCLSDNLNNLFCKYPNNTDAAIKTSYSITRDRRDFLGQLKQCRDCGMVWKYPRPVNISTYYERMVDDLYNEELKARRKTFSQIIILIEKFKKSGRLLDIGCATGCFLNIARNRGWQVCGIELSRWAADFASKTFGINVICGDIKHVNLSSSSFDVITLIDTMEHLTAPFEILKQLHAVQRKGGVLYILIPDIGSWAARIFKGRWWGISEFHLNYFSKKTINSFLSKAGYKILVCRHRGHRFIVKHILQRAIFYYKKPVCLQITLKMIQRILVRYLPVLYEKAVCLNTFDELEILAIKDDDA